MTGILAAWREVKGIVIGLMGFSLLAFLSKWRWLGVGSAILLGWVFYFFRDPERQPPLDSPEWILAPADGTVMEVGLSDESLFFKGAAQRISIFLSVFDVHVQRSPYQGQVQFLKYQPGSFAPAFLKDVEENEYNFIGLSTPQGPVGVKQISGILARRIVCWPQLGDELATGRRLGLIKFGSRVDLFLPLDVEILVAPGQKVNGGQTIVGRWKVDKAV